MSPDHIAFNQIDNILLGKIHNIIDVTLYKATDWESDHFLAVCTLWEKPSQTNYKKTIIQHYNLIQNLDFMYINCNK